MALVCTADLTQGRVTRATAREYSPKYWTYTAHSSLLGLLCIQYMLGVKRRFSSLSVY